MANKRFRRTPEEIDQGLTVEQAKAARIEKEIQDAEKAVAEVCDEPIKTQEELEAKHAENAPTGLGDVVEAITEVTGIKKAVKFLAGEDCGCDERKEKLNKMRFRKQPLCLTESEYTFLHGFFTNSNGMVSQSQNYELATIYARVFQKKGVEVTSCSSCVKQRVKDLKDIYNTYE
jgi:hypothetical protein